MTMRIPTVDINVLRESVDVGVLKNLMDAFGRAHNVGVGIFTPDLKRIVGASNHTHFCQRVRDSRKSGCAIGDKRCEETDMARFPSEGRTVGPYRCHAGNWDFAVPIVTRHDVIIGAIYGGQVRRHTLTAEEVRQLKNLAMDCGIDEADLLEDAAALPVLSDADIDSVIRLTEGIAREIADLVEKRTREHKFLRDLLNAADLQSLLTFAVDYAQSVLEAASCSIFLRCKREGRDILRLEYTSSTHLRDERMQGRLPCDWYEIGEGLTGWVAKENKSLRIDDIRNPREVRGKGNALTWRGKIRETANKEEIVRFLAVPLAEKDASTADGVIRIVATEDRHPFEDGDVTTLRSLARLIWNALEAMRIRQRAEQGKKAMDVLADAAKLVNSDLHPREVLDRTIKATLDVLHDASPTSIFILAHDTEKHEFMIEHGGGKDVSGREIGMRFSASEGIAGYVLQQKLPYYIASDAMNDPHYKPIVNMQSALVVPIRSGTQCSHVISVGSSHKYAFTEEDGKLLMAYSQHMAIALRNAFAQEEASARLALQEIALSAFSVGTSLAPICDVIVGLCRERLRAKVCSLFLINEVNQLVLASSTDVGLKQDQETTGRIYYEMGEGLTGQTAAQVPGKVIRISSIENADELKRVGGGMTPQNKYPEKSLDPSAQCKSFIGMPLHFGQELIGVIRLAQKEGSVTFLQADEAILRALANQAGICLKFAETLREKDLSLKGFAHDAAGTPVGNLLDDTELLVENRGVSLGSLDSETAAMMKRMRLYAIHLGMLMDTYILMGTDWATVPASPSEIDDVREEIIEPILQIVKAPYADKSRECRIDDRVPSNLKVHVDKSRLYAILYNLIKNAMKACECSLCVSCINDGQSLEFRVSDDGKGIDLSRIPAFVTPGRLGLRIARTFTSSLGGSLTFEKPSNSCAGTVAVVRIPQKG